MERKIQIGEDRAITLLGAVKFQMKSLIVVARKGGRNAERAELDIRRLNLALQELDGWLNGDSVSCQEIRQWLDSDSDSDQEMRRQYLRSAGPPREDRDASPFLAARPVSSRPLQKPSPPTDFPSS